MDLDSDSGRRNARPGYYRHSDYGRGARTSGLRHTAHHRRSRTINRIVDAFPEYAAGTDSQLATAIIAIISQVPDAQGRRQRAWSPPMNNGTAVQHLIRKTDRTRLFRPSDRHRVGMVLLDDYLFQVIPGQENHISGHDGIPRT